VYYSNVINIHTHTHTRTHTHTHTHAHTRRQVWDGWMRDTRSSTGGDPLQIRKRKRRGAGRRYVVVFVVFY